MAEHGTRPEAGQRQAQQPEKAGTTPRKDAPPDAEETAKQGNKADRAVADAVSDLDGND